MFREISLNIPPLRAIFSSTLDDERSDDEGDDDPAKEKAE